MTIDPSHPSGSALRERMIEDMNVRGFTEDTRRDYIRCVRRFAAFIGRSPDTATAEDLRRFQVHQTQTGMQPPGINSSVSALRFFFTVTLDRPDLSRRLAVVHQPRKLPLVLSVEEVARLLEAAPGPKYKAAFGTAYGAGLRVSEVVALKVTDIDSTRMLIRVERGPFDRLRGAQRSPRHAVAAAARTAAGLVAGGQAPWRDAAAGLAVSEPQSNHAALHAADEPRRPRRGSSRRDQKAGDAAHAAP
jgi:integrase/recombinase XerD